MLKKISLFSDGACKGNPGPGGWGVILRYGLREKEFFGGERHTTNNRMELQAVIEGLSRLQESCAVEIFTDSQYVLKGMTEWLPNWKRRGWKTARGQAVINHDLWLRLDALAQKHALTWHWVKGHSGHPENERADKLANHGIAML